MSRKFKEGFPSLEIGAMGYQLDVRGTSLFLCVTPEKVDIADCRGEACHEDLMKLCSTKVSIESLKTNQMSQIPIPITSNWASGVGSSQA